MLRGKGKERKRANVIVGWCGKPGYESVEVWDEEAEGGYCLDGWHWVGSGLYMMAVGRNIRGQLYIKSIHGVNGYVGTTTKRSSGIDVRESNK